MDRARKLELIQRSLGLRHKVKVHESMKAPESHEDMAMSMMAKWELEDELKAIEEVLADSRSRNVHGKRHGIELENAKPEGERPKKKKKS